MVNINPFDDSFKKYITGGAHQVQAPSKINEEQMPDNKKGIGGLADIQNTNENDLLDASNITDDSDSFNMSDFSSSEKNYNTEKTNEAADNSSSSKDDNQDKKEGMMHEIAQVIDNCFNKKE